MEPELFDFPNAAALAADVARRWVDAAAHAAAQNAPFRVALSGGRVARDFMAAVATEARRQGLPPEAVDFFWGDERCVPPAHADSNYLLAEENLLKPLGVPAHRIHRLRGEADPATAAREAEAELRAVCPADAQGRPVLDLVLLGMGEDAHVASLFPGAPAEIVASTACYLPVIGPKPPPQRLTLTYDTIQAARMIWVLVSGAGKEAVLLQSLAPDSDTPLARVLRSHFATIFLAH